MNLRSRWRMSCCDECRSLWEVAGVKNAAGLLLPALDLPWDGATGRLARGSRPSSESATSFCENHLELDLLAKVPTRSLWGLDVPRPSLCLQGANQQSSFVGDDAVETPICETPHVVTLVHRPDKKLHTRAMNFDRERLGQQFVVRH